MLGLARAWLDRAPGLPAAPSERAYAQVAGLTIGAPPWLVTLLGLAPLGLLRWRTAPRSCATFAAVALLTVLAGALISRGAQVFWPGFSTAIAEVPNPGPLYAAVLLLGLAGCAFLRRFSPDGMAAPTILLTAAVAGLAPAVGYILVPGAWVAGLRGRRTWWPAVVPALLAGLLLGPFYAAICPALTTRMLPVLAVVPLVTLGGLFSRSAEKGTSAGS